MSLKSTSTQYGHVAIIIHWASAAAVILAFVGGLAASNMDPVPVPLLIGHVALGLTVLALTVLRIVWWIVADRHPAPPANQPRWQQTLARIVHGLLYVLLVVMATSGIMTLVFAGAFPALFAGGPVPDLDGLVPRLAHGVMARMLLALFVLHVGAALYHQFIRRDRLLARMGIGAA